MKRIVSGLLALCLLCALGMKMKRPSLMSQTLPSAGISAKSRALPSSQRDSGGV